MEYDWLQHQRSNQDKEKQMNEKFIVRLFDWYDGWIDVSEALSKEDADILWNEKTSNGTINHQYTTGGIYYHVFPSDTKMMYTSEKINE
jgi:hypothetical protein